MLCRVYTHALGYEVQSSEQKIHLHQYRQSIFVELNSHDYDTSIMLLYMFVTSRLVEILNANTFCMYFTMLPSMQHVRSLQALVTV